MNSKHTTSLSIETVRHIAELTRLALSPEEEILFQRELEKVLLAFQNLSHFHMPEQFDSRSAFLLEEMDAKKLNEQSSHMAPDVPNNSLSTQKFMSDAPDKEGVFVRVPIILANEN